MARDVAGDFTATGGMADVNRVFEVERVDQRREVVGVGVHVIAVPWLARAAVAVVRDAAIAVRSQEEHLVLERVCGKWPAVAEHHGLSLAPVLVINVSTVLSRDRVHGMVSVAVGSLR